MEKVICEMKCQGLEFRVKETDQGYSAEVVGDKEKIQSVLGTSPENICFRIFPARGGCCPCCS